MKGWISLLAERLLVSQAWFYARGYTWIFVQSITFACLTPDQPTEEPVLSVPDKPTFLSWLSSVHQRLAVICMYPALEGEANRQEHKVHAVSSIWAHVKTLEQASRSSDA
jgi:hypothetical protein